MIDLEKKSFVEKKIEDIIISFKSYLSSKIKEGFICDCPDLDLIRPDILKHNAKIDHDDMNCDIETAEQLWLLGVTAHTQFVLENWFILFQKHKDEIIKSLRVDLKDNEFVVSFKDIEVKEG